MKRLFVSLALIAGVVGFSTLTVEAQTKKAELKKGETPPPAKDATAGMVEVYKGKNGFRWRVVDHEGKTIAMPTSNKHWETREEVIKAIGELKDMLNKVKPVDVKE